MEKNERRHTSWLVVNRTQAIKEEYIGWDALILCLQLSPLLKFVAFIAKRLPKSVVTVLQKWADMAHILSQSDIVDQKIRLNPSTSHPIRKKL